MRRFFLILFFGFSTLGLATVQRGDWIASAGVGLGAGILLNPQLEYVYRHNLYFGPMIQLGIGDGILFAPSGTIRYKFEGNRLWKPNVEGGIGIAFASGGSYTSTTGVLFHMGGGVEYVFNSTTSFGTELRLEFAPPVKSSFIAWPLAIGRFLL